MRRVLLAAAVLMLPLVAHAENRFAIEPSIEITEVSDDNLNFSPDAPLRDRVRRVTPALALRFDSPRWSVRSTYGIDSERYANHSALDNNRSRQRMGLDMEYQATSRLKLALGSAFIDTATLADLNDVTGLAASRVRGRRFGVSPSATFRLSPRMAVSTSLSSTTTNAADGFRVRTQDQAFRVERDLTSREVASVEYTHSRAQFDGQLAQLIDTHSLLLGWSRELGPFDRLSLQAGPRLTDHMLTTGFAADLTHRWRRGAIGVSLLRNQTTVVGYVGVVDAQSLQVKYTFAPDRRFSAYAAPAAIRTTHQQLEGMVYRVAFGARYTLASMVDADLAYNRDSQRGAIDPLRANLNLSHATLSLGFTTHWNSAGRMR